MVCGPEDAVAVRISLIKRNKTHFLCEVAHQLGSIQRLGYTENTKSSLAVCSYQQIVTVGRTVCVGLGCPIQPGRISYGEYRLNGIPDLRFVPQVDNLKAGLRETEEGVLVAIYFNGGLLLR